MIGCCHCQEEGDGVDGDEQWQRQDLITNHREEEGDVGGDNMLVAKTM